MYNINNFLQIKTITNHGYGSTISYRKVQKYAEPLSHILDMFRDKPEHDEVFKPKPKHTAPGMDEGEGDEGDRGQTCIILHYPPVDHFSMGLFDSPTAAAVQQKICVEVRSDQLSQFQLVSSAKR